MPAEVNARLWPTAAATAVIVVPAGISTATGVLLLAVVPSPNWPESLKPQARPAPGGPAAADGALCASTPPAPTEAMPSTIANISNTANSPRRPAGRTQLLPTSATLPVQKLATCPYPYQLAESSPVARYKRTKQAQVTKDPRCSCWPAPESGAWGKGPEVVPAPRPGRLIGICGRPGVASRGPLTAMGSMTDPVLSWPSCSFDFRRRLSAPDGASEIHPGAFRFVSFRRG